TMSREIPDKVISNIAKLAKITEPFQIRAVVLARRVLVMDATTLLSGFEKTARGTGAAKKADVQLSKAIFDSTSILSDALKETSPYLRTLLTPPYFAGQTKTPPSFENLQEAVDYFSACSSSAYSIISLYDGNRQRVVRDFFFLQIRLCIER